MDTSWLLSIWDQTLPSVGRWVRKKNVWFFFSLDELDLLFCDSPCRRITSPMMSQFPFGTSCRRCWWVWDTRRRAFTSLTAWFMDWPFSSGCWACSCVLLLPSNQHSHPWEWLWPEPSTTTAANGPKSTWATNQWSAWRRGSHAQFRATPTSKVALDYQTKLLFIHQCQQLGQIVLNGLKFV